MKLNTTPRPTLGFLDTPGLSISKSDTYTKDDRVVVKVDRNEWYIGTVTRAGLKVLVIDFDDGHVSRVGVEDFKDVRLLLKPRRLKRALTNLEAKALYVPPAAVKVPPASQVIVATRPGVKPTPTAKLYKACADPKLFSQALGGSRVDKLAYLREIYTRADKVVFGSGLGKVRIKFLKAQAPDIVPVRWDAAAREIFMSLKVFDGGETAVISSLIAQMCHQATVDIDKRPALSSQAHSHEWITWMLKAGTLQLALL